jgi:hypothetical protein
LNTDLATFFERGCQIKIDNELKKKIKLSETELFHGFITVVFYIVICIVNDGLFRDYGISGIETTIFSPMNEEFFRLISFVIGGPIIIIFTLFVAITEFVAYISMFMDEMAGWAFFAFVIMRVFCVAAHFLFFFIQYKFYKKYIINKQSRYLILGFFCASFAHIIWNVFGSQYIYQIIR